MGKVLYRAAEVVAATCTLLGLPETWETAKRLRSGAPVPIADYYGAPLLVLVGIALFLIAFFFERRTSSGGVPPPTRPGGIEVASHGQAGGQTIGAIHIRDSHVELGPPPARPQIDDEEIRHRIALEKELVDLGHTFYKSLTRWYTAAVERRAADAETHRTETLAAMEHVCRALTTKVNPGAENRFRKAQPAERSYSEHIPRIESGLEINAMWHRSWRLTEIVRSVRTGEEPIAWPLPADEDREPDFPVPRGMAANLEDRRREREAKDRFVLVMPNGSDKSYARADIDTLSFIQRRKLLDQDGAMEEWYRGRRMNTGSWSMVRFDDPGPGGPVWLTFQELRQMPEPDRSAVLIKYNGPIRSWYLQKLEERGEKPLIDIP